MMLDTTVPVIVLSRKRYTRDIYYFRAVNHLKSREQHSDRFAHYIIGKRRQKYIRFSISRRIFVDLQP